MCTSMRYLAALPLRAYPTIPQALQACCTVRPKAKPKPKPKPKPKLTPTPKPKLLDAVPRCKPLCDSWAGARRRWYQRNRSIVVELAKKLDKPLEAAFDFLWQLTLRNFGKILNPKGSGWNWCRVPLSRVDTCDLYAKFFDLNGNLQDPMDPDSLSKLLAIMEYFLNRPAGGPDDDLFDGPYAAGFGASAGGAAFGINNRFQGVNSFNLTELFGAAGFNLGGADGADGTNGKSKRKRGSDSSSQYSLGTDASDLNLKSTDGSSKRNSSKLKLLQSISQHYNKMVEPKVKPPGKPRRILGELLPVLVHEPFNSDKPWTWVRRDPRQNRVMTDGRVGQSRVSRYQQREARAAYEKAKERYSMRSNYSSNLPNFPKKTSMFGQDRKLSKDVSEIEYSPLPTSRKPVPPGDMSTSQIRFK